MLFSRRIVNFAASISIVAALLLCAACKGRTIHNVEPTGDTIEMEIVLPGDTALSAQETDTINPK